MAWATRGCFHSSGNDGTIALTRFITIRPLMASRTQVSRAETTRKPQPMRGFGIRLGSSWFHSNQRKDLLVWRVEIRVLAHFALHFFAFLLMMQQHEAVA